MMVPLAFCIGARDLDGDSRNVGKDVDAGGRNASRSPRQNR